MFGWLRDAIVNTSTNSVSNRHLSMRSSRFRPHDQDQRRQDQDRSSRRQRDKPTNQRGKQMFPTLNDDLDEDDDDEDDEEPATRFHDRAFYHNPYHTSGQMNYIDIPQQQYRNDHNYPTYLAHEPTINQSLDNQIHAKLFALQHRGKQISISSETHSNTQTIENQFSLSKDTSTPSISPNPERNQSFHEENFSPTSEQSIPFDYDLPYRKIDGKLDLASFVLWYKNVMQSVKKIM